jgi:predicted PurR-regulated permease PerM
MAKQKTKINKKALSETLGEKIKKVLLNYFTTQFILMIIIGLATWGALSLLDVRYTVLLAVLTGVLSGIPTFGMIIATIAITLVAIFDKAVFLPNAPAIVEGLVVLLIFILLNKFVDLILAPIFLGKTNKVNPLILILVVFIGSIFFGPIGAILAIPLLLVVKTVIEHKS